MKNDRGSNISLLDLPETTLDCILMRLSPVELCIMSEVCTVLRNRCRSDDLWEEHMKRKWSRLIGEVAYKEWQWQITATKEENPLMIDQNGSAGSFSGDWPYLCLGSYLVDSGHLRGSLSNFFMKAFYLSLESGRFWFPAQLYKSSGLMLQCQNALLSYDSKTNTFQARQQHGGWRFIGKNLGWDMVRAPPVETPPYHLHASDLHSLKPGHHIEIQFRSNTQNPFDWWYAVIGHLETCDENENHCLCHQSDILVVEFKQYPPSSQMRRVKLCKNNNREQNDGMGRFCGGIRKIHSEEEIGTWKTFFPQPRIGQRKINQAIFLKKQKDREHHDHWIKVNPMALDRDRCFQCLCRCQCRCVHIPSRT